MKMPEADDFRAALQKRLAEAEKNRESHCDVQSGDLHRDVGIYPASNHLMPICCDVMRQAMRGEDWIIREPPKKNGASVVIRYMLPRTKP
jgi:hypothetical protein